MWRSSDWFLHNDHAPAHTALSVQQFFFWGGGGGNITVILSLILLIHLTLRHVTFSCLPCMKGQIKGKHFADVSEMIKKMQEVLNNISTEKFQTCFQQWGKRWYKCVESKGGYCEGD